MPDNRQGSNGFRDECGIFGISGHSEAARIAYLGLHALQHRGQESAGIVTSAGNGMNSHRQMGLVQEIFDTATLDRLKGDMAIGHVRYSTAGGSHIRNAQPIVVRTCHGRVAVAHNGTLTNAHQLREDLELGGSIFHSDSDTENFVHLIARSKRAGFVDQILESLAAVKGAFSLLFMSGEQIVAVRDPVGFRPLSLGLLEGCPMVSSESSSFDLVGGRLVRDIEPGEMVVIDRSAKGLGSVRSSFPIPSRERHTCIFEYIYFARPNSIIGGRTVYDARIAMGCKLAQQDHVEADMVIPVPDSGTPAAIGYAQQSGIPFALGLIRSHYVGRTFIEPKNSIRHFGVKLKLSPVASLIKGKRVVVVDDSIVRGTTSKKIVGMIREAGAKEVHFRVSSPPTRFSCFYGIDTPTRRELIASTSTVEDIADFIEVDSLGYLSLDGTVEACGAGNTGFCHACFSGDYPVPIPSFASDEQTSLEGF
jgi:amidophosphoribosyltransferase